MIRMIFWSIISSVAGASPRAISADTASPAASTDSNATISVRTAGGLRTSRRLASMTMPSVPSLPVSRPTKSYSG
jgi:hypothetical protein